MVGPARPIRVYADTSVIGGCLDEESRTPSIRLFDRSRAGGTLLVVSDITLAELASAPARVRNVIEDLPRGCLELIHQNAESEALAEEYNAVNLRTGYPLLEIRSPLEVWKDDDENL